MTDNAPPLADTNLLVGIDDTDTEAGKGTGSLARGLLVSFDEQRIGAALGATRHQLLLDPAIAYTSENAAHCVARTSMPLASARSAESRPARSAYPNGVCAIQTIATSATATIPCVKWKYA